MVFCTVADTARSDCSDGQIRLVGGTILAGRLEVCINSAWGTVCDEGPFSADEAQVACNQTGLPYKGTEWNYVLVMRLSFYCLCRGDCAKRCIIRERIWSNFHHPIVLFWS